MPCYLNYSSKNLVDSAKSRVSERPSHLRDHPDIDPFHPYINILNSWMLPLRVPINPVHTGLQLDRTLHSVASKPGLVVEQRVIGHDCLQLVGLVDTCYSIIFRKKEIRISTTIVPLTSSRWCADSMRW